MSNESLSEFSLAAIEEAAAQFFDTKALFDEWIQSREIAGSNDESECEVIFAGVLRVDGLIRGQIRSAHGTLFMTERGRIEADVDVRVAIIDGYLAGTLRATEHVVLGSNSRVTGDIHTPSLSISDGAVFEGQSYFLERGIYSEICKLESDWEVPLAMVAAV
jgi:cytoskeletal protein CcmA (bactofilin family)